jgi:hypothetical protein
MMWMYWLLAPVISTVAGAVVIWWRSRSEDRRRSGPSDAMSQHQALLRALPAGGAAESLPLTVRVLQPEPPTDQRRSGLRH